MNKESYQLTKNILIKAQQLPVADRVAFVKESCHKHPKLIEGIMEMLSLEASDAFDDMDMPALVYQLPELESEISDHAITLSANSQFGQYKIIKKIGAGGMGVVYQAQQDYPAERQVALKLLKKLPNQHLLIKETQILALLNHPNIATLYEIDTNQDGQLYLAMELIDGKDIVHWCNSNNYTNKDIIQLFLQLCSSISYAHEKGIIHCDIKPSNVLVTKINNKDTVKIIDFGISQYEHQQTNNNEISGTPTYLAPEVLSNKNSPIADTRRDVYALGVLLSKLLREKPSQDLKLIISKARAQDKKQRYATAANLSYDLNNYLKKFPVSARETTYLYTSKLFIQRRLGFVLFSSVLLLSLFGGFIAQSRQAKIASEQAQAAQIAQLEAEELSEFLTDLFNVANPERSNNDIITANDLIDNAKQKLISIKDPTVSDARFMYTIGSIYANKDNLSNALIMIEKSLQINQAQLPENHPSIIAGLSQIGLINKKLKEFDKAEAFYNAAMKAIKTHSNPDLKQLANVYNHMGNLYIETEKIEKAIENHQLAINLRKDFEDLKPLADSYNNLGVIYHNLKKWDLAGKYYYLALDIFNEEYDEHHPFIGVMKNNLAHIEEYNFNWQKSEDLLIESWINWVYAYGENHSKTIIVQKNLALFYDRRMKYQKAIDLYNLILKAVNSNKEQQAKYTSLKALSYANKNDYESANKYHRLALEITNDINIKEKYLYAKIRTQFAKTLMKQDRFSEAKTQLNQALEFLNQNYEKNNYYRLYTLNMLADISYQENDFEQSQLLFNEVLKFKIPTSISNQTRQVTANIGLGRVFHKLKDYAKSQSYFDQALKVNLSNQGKQFQTNGIIYYELTKLKLSQKQMSQANQYLTQALDIQKLVLPSNHKDLMATKELLKNL